MKQTLLRTLKILAVLVPALVMMLLVTGKSSDERNKIRDFYREPEQSLDVVILGSSEVFTGYSAPMAYENFGFTSYPFAMSSNRSLLYASQLKEIYSRQTPSLVVVEITPCLYTEPPSNMDMSLRGYIEKVPLSWNKLQTVWEYGDRDHMLSYFLPFLMYHGSGDLDTILSTLSDDFFLYRQGYSLLKGSTSSTLRDYADNAAVLTGEETFHMELSDYVHSNLQSLLEHCNAQGYKNLLFVTFPHRITTEYAFERYLDTRAAGALIESYGYPYLNMETLADEIGLDYAQDYYNDDHMNLYGQKKFTEFLGNLLVEEYGVNPSAQTQQNRERWETSVDFSQRYYAYFDDLYQNDPGTVWMWENKWVIQDLGGPIWD